MGELGDAQYQEELINIRDGGLLFTRVIIRELMHARETRPGSTPGKH
jgi:hypothetical protein